MIIGIVGPILEYCLIPDKQAPLAMSHIDHFTVLSLFLLAGTIQTLHVMDYLKHSVWAFCVPLSLSFVGTLFNIHEQADDFAKTAHQINATIFYFGSISRCVEILIRLYCNRQHFLRTTNDFPRVSKWFGTLKLNPLYTNHIVFTTVFPMVTGLSVILAGMWWWEMAIHIFLSPFPEGMRTTHKAYLTFAKHVGILLGVAAFVSFVLEHLDKRFSKNKTKDLELQDLERQNLVKEDKLPSNPTF